MPATGPNSIRLNFSSQKYLAALLSYAFGTGHSEAGASASDIRSGLPGEMGFEDQSPFVLAGRFALGTAGNPL